MKRNKQSNPVKLTKVKTINDILARDDINGILADLDKMKPDISDLIVIHYDKEKDTYGFQITEDTNNALIVFLLEAIKLDIMNTGE